MPFFRIYKKGQGKYTRMLTLVTAVVLGTIGAYLLSMFLEGKVSTYIRFGVPMVVVVVLSAVVLWVINREKSADFLIATEGEMKKVSWSTRKEIVGSTKVVIIATFMMAALLYGVDMLFLFLFSRLPMK
ncbi:MAG: preprotein translocase subunit SecE [Phycisphaerae bacterium]|nr:preprotein translocase subunit SecE [Phycisphaerae bacterium]